MNFCCCNFSLLNFLLKYKSIQIWKRIPLFKLKLDSWISNVIPVEKGRESGLADKTSQCSTNSHFSTPVNLNPSAWENTNVSKQEIQTLRLRNPFVSAGKRVQQSRRTGNQVVLSREWRRLLLFLFEEIKTRKEAANKDWILLVYISNIFHPHHRCRHHQHHLCRYHHHHLCHDIRIVKRWIDGGDLGKEGWS